MNEYRYNLVISWIKKNRIRLDTFKFLYGILPVIVFLTYATLVLYLGATADARLFKVIIIPATIVVIVSILRKYLNTPRPYTKFAINPIMKKGTSGESFPSRHAVSASLICMACFYINNYLGLFMLIMTILIAIIRVMAGVHFIKDVLAGSAIGFLLGGFAFWL